MRSVNSVHVSGEGESLIVTKRTRKGRKHANRTLAGDSVVSRCEDTLELIE